MIDNKFIIITPVYNAELYIEKCIESILSQTHKNYELVVVDDCSTDKTFDIICELHKKHNFSFNYIKNHIRIGSALANIVRGVELFSRDKEDIIINVDGDDYLASERVLEYLNVIYQDENIYMTYGQFEPLSKTYSHYCRPIPNTRTYRQSRIWVSSHLRTVKRKLFDKINKDDLKDSQGNYYKTAWDLAYMYPSIEMSGPNHIKFIDKVLYIYNDLNPNNDMKVSEALQLATAQEIQNKPVYAELTEKL